MTQPDFRVLAQELLQHAQEAQAILIGEGLWDVDDDEGLFDRADKALATPPPEPGKSIEELIAGCKPLDPEMAEMLTPCARWRLFGEDNSLPLPPEPPTDKELEKVADHYMVMDGATGSMSLEHLHFARAVLERWGNG